MANTIDLNVSPYYDDFDPTKDFLRVLFRPGYPVQARELNTLQSFLQEQVARHGNWTFKDGSRVLEGGITFDANVTRLTLTSSNNTSFPPANAAAGAILSNIESFEGKMITDASQTVKALVLKQPNTTTTTSSLGDLYIKYISEKEFDSDGGFIYALPADNADLTSTYYNTYSSFTNAAVATVQEGVYYIREHFTRMPKQTVVVSSTSNTPSKEVGFTVSSTFVTQNDDSTLYDIATGSPNEGAPGAHRFTQTISMVVKELDEDTSTKFYSVLRIEDGVVQGQTTGNPQLAELGKEFARRTYDESGHYTVKPFSVHVTKVADSDEKYLLNVSKGKAYVAGFEHETPSTIKIETEKELSTSRVKNRKIPVVGSSSIELVSHNSGSLPGSNGGDTTTFANRLLLKDSDGDVIGICRAYTYQDEFSRGVLRKKLYFYDAKLFQVLTLDSDISSNLQSGNDIYYNDTIGYIYNDATDTAWLSATQIALINSNGKFRINQPVSTTLNSATATITATNHYDWTDVVAIEDTTGTFTAVVAQGTVPTQGSLFQAVQSVVATAADAGGPLDNSVTLIEHTGVATGTPNGEWNEEDKNDVDQVDKTLRFQYLHIKNLASNRTNVNYGWLAQDKHIHLGVVDALKVYRITKSADGTFASGQFQRLNITTAGVLPQGSVLKGETSGNEAVVALSNTTVTGLTDLSSGAGYHEVKTGTGDSALVEVVWQKGSRFEANEKLIVTTPAGASAYTAIVTYNSVGTEIGEDYTNNFLLDDGQRLEFYDVSRLVRKRNKPAPSGVESLVVFYSYYEADPSLLGYYNVDSYSPENFWTTDPRFAIEPRDITFKGLPGGVDLRNVWDFRFRSTGPSTSVANSPFVFQNRAFYDQPRIKPGTNFTTDYEEYLARIDALTMNEKGNLRILKGKPNTPTNVKEPTVPDRSLHIATVYNPPAERYPEYKTNVTVHDNRRYTMSDIGKLDRRITRVEEAVSLSILESQALSDNIEDRERVGFVTDDFSSVSQGFGDGLHADFNASILSDSQTLIPPTTAGQPVDLDISSMVNIDSWYLSNGRRNIVKAYDQAVMIKQLDTTGDYLINPFQSWVYQGSITLTPAKQFWKETIRSYFTRLNGETQPFNGDSDAFWALSRITEPDPNGFTETVQQWTGSPQTRQVVAGTFSTSEPASTPGWAWITDTTVFNNQERTTTTTITTRTFDEPISTGVDTIGSLRVAPFPANHKMDPITISFKATGLKPNVEHSLTFSGKPATDIIGKTRPTFITDDKGEVSGTFGVPRNTYNVGDHLFSISATENPAKSFADAPFNSSGYLEYESLLLNQETVTTTDRSVVTGPWRTTSTSERSNTWLDPIAQTFALPVQSPADAQQILTNQAGAREQESFITSVDVWFTDIDSRTNMNKVILQIREVVNGYPGGYDKVLGAAELFVDRNTYQQTAGSQQITDALAVNFRFPNPVRLLGGKEYCIVLLSPSDVNKVCVAEIGQNLIGKNGIHDEQPNVGGHFGSFFVSQNGETWNAEQNIDLTFRMYRADFGKGSETPADSTVTLENKISNGLSSADLYTEGAQPLGFRADIGNFAQGLCFETFENSNYVKVYHPNHGMHHDGALVVIWGVEQTYPNGTTKDYNGIPVSEIDLGVTESTFQTTTSAHTVYYPTLNSYFIKTTTKATSSGLVNAGRAACATQNIVYDLVISNLNAAVFDGTSVSQRLKTSTTCSANLEVLNNKINNASLSVVVQDDFLDIVPGTLTRYSTPKIVRSKVNAGSTVDLTSFLTLTSDSRWTSPIIPNGRNLDPIAIRCVTGNLLDDSDIEGLTTRSITSSSTNDQLLEYASYIAAVESNQEHSAYVSKAINLEIPANGIDIYFDADMQPGAEIECFYKASAVSDETPFGLLEWQPFHQSTAVNEKNYGEFGSDAVFKQYKLHVPVGFDFDSFKVKIRMNCQNEAEFPTIKNLRVIGDIIV